MTRIIVPLLIGVSFVLGILLCTIGVSVYFARHPIVYGASVPPDTTTKAQADRERFLHRLQGAALALVVEGALGGLAVLCYAVWYVVNILRALSAWG